MSGVDIFVTLRFCFMHTSFYIRFIFYKNELLFKRCYARIVIYVNGEGLTYWKEEMHMYDCPACGGNLKFDIASQMLACGYCNAQYDPYEITKNKDGEEQTDYEVTVFTCPQCGGEIYSTDNTAAGFCSFCGASTILTSRISREKRPNFIITFRKTKEDCKREYEKLMRRFIFAPKELRDPAHIDGFRGIYMPYWVYYYSQRGRMSIMGTKSHRSGDYIITKHYQLTGNLDAYYKGISYDGSSSFSDRISERIAPYDVKNMKEFTPSLLSGFYADTADVGKEIYRSDAKDLADGQTTKYLKRDKNIKKYDISKNTGLSGRYNTREESVDLAMFPVWFLSYRNKDRVAYATVNGQTGKVFADMPVSIPKYLVGSFILAIPLFILLNMFLTVVPKTLIGLVSVVAAIVALVYSIELSNIDKKENEDDDKGLQEGKRQAAARKLERDRANGIVDNAESKPQEKKKSSSNYLLPVVATIGTFAVIFGGSFLFMFLGSPGGIVVCIVTFIVILISFLISNKKVKNIEAKKGLPATLWMLIAEALVIVVGILSPAADIYYYIMAALILASVGFTLFDLIRCYNILATRRLPQFDYQGGDDNA